MAWKGKDKKKKDGLCSDRLSVPVLEFDNQPHTVKVEYSKYFCTCTLNPSAYGVEHGRMHQETAPAASRFGRRIRYGAHQHGNLFLA